MIAFILYFVGTTHEETSTLSKLGISFTPETAQFWCRGIFVKVSVVWTPHMWSCEICINPIKHTFERRALWLVNDPCSTRDSWVTRWGVQFNDWNWSNPAYVWTTYFKGTRLDWNALFHILTTKYFEVLKHSEMLFLSVLLRCQNARAAKFRSCYVVQGSREEMVRYMR